MRVGGRRPVSRPRYGSSPPLPTVLRCSVIEAGICVAFGHPPRTRPRHTAPKIASANPRQGAPYLAPPVNRHRIPHVFFRRDSTAAA
uniref:Uncharacterized protein n=1 Tax=Anopheles albimanus TaxID=7167 RepID=A0A182FY42_ANOAL